MVILLTGVSGAGKTTIGQRLALAQGWAFHDADDLHDETSIAKMSLGQALTELDRAPWLGRVRAVVERALARGESCVVACSALKDAHRRLLVVDTQQVRVVFLTAPPSVIQERLEQRRGHFMPPSLLTSQLLTLESPHEGVVQVDVSGSPEQTVARIQRALGLG